MSEYIKLLVVDDSEDDRLLYRRALKNNIGEPCSIVEADSGEEGIKHLSEEHFSCVLLDYSMPGYDGVEILKRIRAEHPFLAVVMLTGQGNEKVAVHAMQEGAQNYISKDNITPQSLEHVVKSAIQHCQMQKRIHDQRTSLEVFSRALAHDLKEPVRSICSLVEMIQKRESFTGKTGDYFKFVHSAANRMRMLIDTVFLYTRLDDPKPVEKETCEVSAVLKEVQENLSQLIRERKATITAGPLPTINVNHIQLIQLLQNLISNAIRHCANAVTIHISAEEQQENWLFRVSDNGPGIEEIYLHRIFEPFQRLVNYEVEGSGLGLAICRKIVESHGGEIWCESTYGTGTTMLFTLPQAVSATATSTTFKAEPAVTIAPQNDGMLANIMLVDDSSADRMVTRFTLTDVEGLNCNFTEAYSGKDALATLHDTLKNGTRIDLLLVDINMPEMNGFELIERIQNEERLKDIPVVMCTGSDYDKDIQRAKSLGVAGYLVKPLDFSKLKTILSYMPHMTLRPEDTGFTLLRVA